MNTASYTDTFTSTGGANKYPLSTETLDFIQDQIRLLEKLAGIGGGNYILQAENGGGVVVITKGGKTEVLELMDKPEYSKSINFVNVITETENIKADDETYLEARTYRRAQFSTTKGAENYAINDFANVSNNVLSPFPSNASLAGQIAGLPNAVLERLRDTLAKKLTSDTQKGLTKETIDTLRTPIVLSCAESVALFGMADYTLIVTAQGSQKVRQELIQGNDQRYVRTGDRTTWGAWEHRTETAMHLEVKIVGTTVYVRHGAIGEDCSLVLLRKKKRSAWRATGGPQAYTKNKGIRKKRAAKTQYVYFKGIQLSKGTPGKWYVPKCISVADKAVDGILIGKELPGLCASLFRVGHGGYFRIQGVHKKIVLKNEPSQKDTRHSGYAPIGLQIARLNTEGGKDSGGEIVRMKYRISQYVTATKTGTNGKPIPISWAFKRSFSVE